MNWGPLGNQNQQSGSRLVHHCGAGRLGQRTAQPKPAMRHELQSIDWMIPVRQLQVAEVYRLGWQELVAPLAAGKSFERSFPAAHSIGKGFDRLRFVAVTSNRLDDSRRSVKRALKAEQSVLVTVDIAATVA